MTTPGDPAQFERTTLPFLTDCFAFAVSLAGNAPDAEDLVQETYLKAQKAFDGFTPGTNAKAWLFTILRRVHIDRIRRARIRPVATPDEELEGLAAGRSGREEEVVFEATPEEVRAALERVPEAFRLAVRLRDLDGFTYAEIGRVLDIPPGTVMSRIHRGRESLRRLLVESRTGGPHRGPPESPARATQVDRPGPTPRPSTGTP